MGSIPCQETKVPHAMQGGQKKKKKYIYIYIYVCMYILRTCLGDWKHGNRAPLPSGNVCSSERVNDFPSSR